MDRFKDRLSQRAQDTTRPQLAHQSRGRDLSPEERELAVALMGIYGVGIHDFAGVAKELSRRGVVAPRSGSRQWSEALLEQELTAANTALDDAYQANGYGA